MFGRSLYRDFQHVLYTQVRPLTRALDIGVSLSWIIFMSFGRLRFVVSPYFYCYRYRFRSGCLHKYEYVGHRSVHSRYSCMVSANMDGHTCVNHKPFLSCVHIGCGAVRTAQRHAVVAVNANHSPTITFRNLINYFVIHKIPIPQIS